MGCGKSKHDVVASGNTVLKRKKSSVKCNCKDQETGAQTKADDNSNNVNVNNVGNVNSGEEVQKVGNNVVKEVVVGGKVENATSAPEETVLQKKDDIVVAGENNGNVEEEKVVEKKSEEVVVAAAEVENKTEKTDVEEVKEEETKDKEVGDGAEGPVLKEVCEEDGALKLNENDQKVNDDAPVEEENKNGELIDEVGVKEEIVAKEEAPEDKINVAASEGEENDLKAEERKKNSLSNEEKANEKAN
ncbi:hypothetical protein QN277_026707 [Acacia crassicarpa]|uniref:Uncharacterized protein n=1 Tax=Acacia crassicarpa TaxID=499986 RepID=A0AAE1MI35_9FABA|nr:hypothetical protein QN277_026707 [Acacia crassicarpa]